MKNLITFLFFLQISLFAFSQGKQKEIRPFENLKNIPRIDMATPNLKAIHEEDLLREKNGELYRIGVSMESNISTSNSGDWIIHNDGSKTWYVRVSSPGAEALSFLFSKFILYGGSVLTIRDLNGKLVHKPMTSLDVIDHQMQNAALCFGNDLVIEIYEPANVQASEILIDRVIYNYRSTGNPNANKINESQYCEVNVNCSPVGDSWQDEKDGVARIYVVEGNSAGWCTGSLVNNTAQDCKPYFLTALHCGVNTSSGNMNQWRFYFRYESPNCNNPSTAGTLDDHYIQGCFRIADSDDGGGNSGSDFLLVQLGAASNETFTVNTLKSSDFSAYWNGWKSSSSASQGGAGIHHPSGDIKKISTFNGNTQSTSWGSAGGSHWQLSWSSNANGHGVTEGGSSGSPLFNNSGQIIGTLTGGSSYCNTPTSPDLYGKMSYHWTSNGNANDEKLKPWLDPTNSNASTLGGSYDPCSGGGTGPGPNDCELQTNNILKVSLLTDDYASETYLELTNSDGNVVWSEGNENVAGNFGTGQENPTADPTNALQNLTQYDWDVTLPTSDCYTFSIYDYYGDGLGAAQWGGTDGNLVLKNNTGTNIHSIPGDFGGSSSVTVENTGGTTGIEEMTENIILIYPNPSNNFIMVDLTQLSTEANSIEIYDVTGKHMGSFAVESNGIIKIDLNDYTNGMYQLRIDTSNAPIIKRFAKK